MPSAGPPLVARPDYPNIPTAITRRESDLLAELTAGKRVLEIGSYLGYSTVWMALNRARVVAVDDHEWMGSWSEYQDNLRRYGVERRVLTVRALSTALPAVPTLSLFDAAFIDGDHAYESAAFDLRLARRVVKSGGWIVAHDYTFPGWHGGGWPGVIRAVDEALGDLAEIRREGCIYAARLPAPAAS